jgi:hypothetical protein
MTIAMATMTTGSNLHGTILPQPWNESRSIQTWFGLAGEYHLFGRLHGREFAAWMQFVGYTSHNLIQAAIETMNAQIGEFGTVTYTVGTDIKTFGNSIFMGFTPEEDPWLDGSGINGWNCRGKLTWRQIKT